MSAHKPPIVSDPESRVQIQPDIFKGYVLTVDSYKVYIPEGLVEVFFATIKKWHIVHSEAKQEAHDG